MTHLNVIPNETDSGKTNQPGTYTFVKRYRNFNIYQTPDGRYIWRIETIRAWHDPEAVEKAIDSMIVDAAISMSIAEVASIREHAEIEHEQERKAGPADPAAGKPPLADQ